MTRDDTNDYRQRAVAQHALALASKRQEVREIHEELARQYEARVQKADPRPILRIVVHKARENAQ